jgi:hypothetical protein
VSFFAPRITRRLLNEIDRLARGPDCVADICRAVGEHADEQGLRRPSYEQVRVHVQRARRQPGRVSTGRVLVEVGLRLHHPDVFLQHVSGTQTRFERK